MAGDWVAIDHETPDKHEVGMIFERTGTEIGTILGRLTLLWIHADRLTEDGFIPGMGMRRLCQLFGGDVQFWEAVAETQWIELSPQGVKVNDFEERFGTSARRRMLHAKQVATRRANGLLDDDERDVAHKLRTDGAHEAHNGARGAHPVPVPVPVSKKPVTGTGAFAGLGEPDLSNTARLAEWQRDAARRKNPLVSNSESDLLRIVGAAERAIEKGKKPLALFTSIVKDRKWHLITQEQEDRARERIAELQTAKTHDHIAGIAFPENP